MPEPLMKEDDISAYLQLSKSSVARIVNLKDFPAPVIVPSPNGTGERQQKRWESADVQAWARANKVAA